MRTDEKRPTPPPFIMRVSYTFYETSVHIMCLQNRILKGNTMLINADTLSTICCDDITIVVSLLL